MKSNRRSNSKTSHLTHGNVLDDLSFSPSEALEIKVKAEIYRDLLQYIAQQQFTQQELGVRLGIHQPDVSNLLGGRISKFSVGKLIKLAGKLNLGASVKLHVPKITAKRPATAIYAKPSRRTTVAEHR
jgi:predicted XRE-type DNA-binding protein